MSQRMGLPKATLPFGPETMLSRVARLLGEVVQPLVVVAAPEQELPKLDDAVLLVRDRDYGRGPLEGMAVGLHAIAATADAAYVTSCDVPLLRPGFVRRLIELLADYDICVPRDARFHHPLAAVYRTRVAATIERLLQANRMRPRFLYEEVSTREVLVEDLRDVDDDLQTLDNVNRPEDYFRALAREGFAVPDTIKAKLKESG